MKTTVPYNFKKAILFGALVALPFAFAGCEKEDTTPNNNGGNGGTNPGGGTQPQKHNVELVYDRSLSSLPIDTVTAYALQHDVDTVFMIPEQTDQYAVFSANQLSPYMKALRKRHNVNPKKVFGKGNMELSTTIVSQNPEIVSFFADTLKYNVVYNSYKKTK